MTELREQIREAVRTNPRQMTLQLARQFNVPEVEIVRVLPGDRAVELDAGRWEEILRSLEGLSKLHVIVSNGGATLEAVGAFGGFSTTDEFFNVQTASLDMHIRWPELAAIFAIEKPGHLDGSPTLSLQFFDRAGHAAFKVFLHFAGKSSPEKVATFAALRERFRGAGPAASGPSQASGGR